MVSSFLSAILVFAVVAVAQPGEVLGATLSKVALCNANLRTSPRTSAPARKVIATGTRVTANLRLVGGNWRTTCAGVAVSGHSWYRITAVNGKSVKSLYGVTYLYAAVGLFKTYVPPPVTKYAACRANLRTSASTGATARTVINTDTKVLVVTQVTGSSYSTTCAGKAVSGKSWYRISAVNGKSVKSLYGVTYLYSATGLYKSTVTTTQAPTPTPTPPPAADPDPDGDSDADPDTRRPRRRTPKGSTSAIGRARSTGPRWRRPASGSRS